MKIKGRKFGFTLTEIMIALTILGVIAALTVPGMRRDYTRRQFETAISKFYTDLMQVGPLAQTTSGRNNLTYDTSFSTENNWPEKYLRGALRGNGAIGPQSGKTNGFADSYRSIDGSDVKTKAEICGSDSVKTFALDNGYVLCSHACDPASGSTTVELYVDTNGSKAPNIAGLDLFHLEMDINSGADGNVLESLNNGVDACKASAKAEGCFSLVLDNNLKITYY